MKRLPLGMALALCAQAASTHEVSLRLGGKDIGSGCSRPARYRETCAKLERDASGRIVMPPPDIAPSCSY